MRLAIILGSGECGDCEVLRALPRVDAVYAVNDTAAEFPGRLTAFVTLHPEKLPAWLGKRKALGLPEPREVVAHQAHELVTRVVDYLWPGMNSSGSSGLFAAKVALKDDPDWGVLLCGVPMDRARTQYTESKFHEEVGGFLDAWQIALPYLRERVRSMSGRTAEWLGRPDSTWLGMVPQP